MIMSSISPANDHDWATQEGKPAERVLYGHAHERQSRPHVIERGLHSFEQPVGMRASTDKCTQMTNTKNDYMQKSSAVWHRMLSACYYTYPILIT